jgi:hypothetical protein
MNNQPLVMKNKASQTRWPYQYIRCCTSMYCVNNRFTCCEKLYVRVNHFSLTCQSFLYLHFMSCIFWDLHFIFTRRPCISFENIFTCRGRSKYILFALFTILENYGLQKKLKYFTSKKIISGYGFLKQQCKTVMGARWSRRTYLIQVIDEACNNVGSCKMTKENLPYTSHWWSL